MNVARLVGGLPVLAISCLSLTMMIPVIAPLRVDAADLQTIKRRGRLIVAVKENLRPLGFRGSDGQLQGFEIDLARQLAVEILGRADAVEFRPTLNQDRLNTVLKNEADVAIAQISLTPSRLRILDFSLPYYRDGVAIATRDAAVQTLANLRGKPIIVLNNSSAAAAVRRQLPGANLMGVDSYAEAKATLETGRGAAIAADASVLAGWVQEFPQYRLLSPLLSSEWLCVVLPKGQQYNDLQQEIDQILTRLTTSGWLIDRANYWGLPRNLSF